MRFRTLVTVFTLTWPLLGRAATTTPTTTVTPTATQTASPDWAATAAAGSWTPTVSPSPSRTATVTPSPWATATPTRTVTVTPALSATPTLSGTATPDLALTAAVQTALAGTLTAVAALPTATPTRTATPAPDLAAIASFEGSDPVTPQAVSAQGGTIVLTVVPGCPYGSAGAACQASGVCDGTGAYDSQLFLSFTAGAADESLPESLTRRLTFHVLATTLPADALQVTVHTLYGDFYTALTVTALGVWTDVTVSLPDDQAPGDWQLAPGSPAPTQPWATAIHACTGVSIEPLAPGAFNFTIDDVRWGSAATGSSPSQVAAALGVSLADVTEAYSYGLGDQATWVLLVLTRHCGCHPHTVMAWRATMTWGQMAVQAGSTWGAILDEAAAAEAAAGLDPDPALPESLLNVLQNGPPSLTPLPSVTPYAPTGPVAMPSPGGC